MTTSIGGKLGLERKSLEEVIVEEAKEASHTSLESSASDASDALQRDQLKFRRPLLGSNHKAAEGSETPEDSSEGPLGPQPRRRRWFNLPRRSHPSGEDDALSRISEGTAASTHRHTNTGSEGPTPRTNMGQPSSPTSHSPGVICNSLCMQPLLVASHHADTDIIRLIFTGSSPAPRQMCINPCNNSLQQCVQMLSSLLLLSILDQPDGCASQPETARC